MQHRSDATGRGRKTLVAQWVGGEVECTDAIEFIYRNGDPQVQDLGTGNRITRG